VPRTIGHGTPGEVAHAVGDFCCTAWLVSISNRRAQRMGQKQHAGVLARAVVQAVEARAPARVMPAPKKHALLKYWVVCTD
jgi:hypothetical protein